MPTALRPARLLVAAFLIVGTALAAAPSLVAALEPPRPLPGYHPAFVTETDQRPMKDCLWASGAMLLDKWTNGRITATHQQLRRLAGDRGGSVLTDLHAAYARLGIDLRFSPDGGEQITWPVLLRRLRAGAGAVLLGDDHKLPRYYGRWDYKFWKGKGKKDNHAVYIERYDPRRGRVWLMDPLGRGDWKGEWVSVSFLRRFVWTTRGGVLYAAVSPTARPAPFAGVRLSEPEFTATPDRLTASWSLAGPRGWSFQGADVRAGFAPAPNPLTAAAMSPGVTSIEPDGHAAPRRPVASSTARTLRATAALPARPGAYIASLRLTDRRFGRLVTQADDVAVFVPGSRSGRVQVRAATSGVAGGSKLPITVSVTNTGTETWADTRPVGGPQDVGPARNTRVMARWIQVGPVDGDRLAGVIAPGNPATMPALPAAGDLEPFEIGRVPLLPNETDRLRATVRAPSVPGDWVLAVDIADDVDGSFAVLGSAPGAVTVEVVGARDFTPED